MSKSTVHRLCGELVEWGVVERAGEQWQLGTVLFELGQGVPAVRSLRDIAIPYMEDLFQVTGETVHLGVPRGTQVMYVEKITGHNPVLAPSRVGGRQPMYCTAIGKAMLAFSPSSLTSEVLATGLKRRAPLTIVLPRRLHDELLRIHTVGVALEREESAAGVACAAAPLLGARGELYGAISVTASREKHDPQQFAPAVRMAATALSRAIGKTRSHGQTGFV